MRYNLFGRTGLRVSTMALGAANFGKGWGYGSDNDEARKVFEHYREAGGNFIDTADQYQFGQSETLLGDFIAADRDDIVLATKFSLGDSPNSGLFRTGNSRKAMIQSVEASLKRLKTDRIDLLWVHMPDGVTPMDEIARGLNDLVASGKILYAGLSDFPAWRVSAGVTTAELRGWAPIAAVQLEYSLVERTVERELLPMAAAFGLATVTWSPLGGGLLTGKYRLGETGRVQGLGAVVHTESDPTKTRILDVVIEIANQLNCSPGQVALAWVLLRGCTPLLGPRTLVQLKDNMAALDIVLSAEQVGLLNNASNVAMGFPYDIVASSAETLAGGKLHQLNYSGYPVR
jgi:aryl-alcohol dehydrogenase-like predicted oxidoreductase